MIMGEDSQRIECDLF